MCVQNLKSVALSIPGIKGYPKNFRESLLMLTLPISPKNPLHTDYSFMCTRFPAIFVWSFGWGLRTFNLEEGGVGVENGTIRKFASMNASVNKQEVRAVRYRDTHDTCAVSRYFLLLRYTAVVSSRTIPTTGIDDKYPGIVAIAQHYDE